MPSELDPDTNNIGLVLAFAPSDGQVLLFRGDAQVGNWLSWRDQIYSHEDKKGQIPADDLLRSVSLYKVGIMPAVMQPCGNWDLKKWRIGG